MTSVTQTIFVLDTLDIFFLESNHGIRNYRFVCPHSLLTAELFEITKLVTFIQSIFTCDVSFQLLKISNIDCYNCVATFLFENVSKKKLKKN